MRKNNILDVFLTNDDKLTQEIIISETSMSDHNIIQTETNLKIVKEKQNPQIKKSSLSFRDFNFFNEDISWASIDADLFNKSWDMLLGYHPSKNKSFLLYILEKNYINKTCRSCFEKMFLFMKILCQP